MKYMLEVKNLNVRYSGQAVLDNLSLSIAEGRFVSVVGPSGSGKTTLLHTLAGFINTDSNVSRPSDIGVVFQKDGVFPFMTVKENLQFALKSEYGMRELLANVGLNGLEKRYPSELSGGQIQRLNFARAVALEPSLVLCDEPFSALDEITRNQMQEWLLDQWSKIGSTVVFVTHSIEEAIFLSDQILVLNDGRITRTFEVDFPRPRVRNLRFSAEFVELRRQILESYY